MITKHVRSSALEKEQSCVALSDVCEHSRAQIQAFRDVKLSGLLESVLSCSVASEAMLS